MARCGRCMGNKRVQGIGWIDVECPQCAGTGSVFNPAKLSDTTSLIKTAGHDAAISIDGAHNGTAEPFTKLDKTVSSKGKAKSVPRGARA